MADLNKPQYNSTLKLTQKLNQIRNEKIKVDLSPEELERIHEKASTKLNLQGQIFDGLVPVEPKEEDFRKILEHKNRPRVKPQINPRPGSQNAPDPMEFYPSDLIKEYPEVEIEPVKLKKPTTIKADKLLLNDPIDKYFKWN